MSSELPLVIHHIPTGKWKENSYVISNSFGEALLIDPGGKAEALEEYLEEKKIKPLAILNTHAHYDHIGAVSELKARYAVPFYLHSKDVRLLKTANFTLKIFEGTE